ncbi:MAG: DOMON domain-containing protein [Planctomycetota bacterium]
MTKRNATAIAALSFVIATACGCGKKPGRVPISADGPPVAVRPENLVVLPATGPVTHVLVQNLHNDTYRGTVELVCPEGWRLDAAEKPVTIEPAALARVPFAIEKGVDSAENVYPLKVRATGGGQDISWDGTVRAATTPYFKPEIDGKLEDWKVSVPFEFGREGAKVSVGTYWSRRNFSLLVKVEEKEFKAPAGGAVADAIQFAISPSGAQTPLEPGGKAARHEFLVAFEEDSGIGMGNCFRLMAPGDPVSAGREARPLGGSEVEGAKVMVLSDGNVTFYECAIPFKALKGVRAEPGREYRFSLLVHDPDGTGLRDLGGAVGLWPWQRSRLAWSDWHGAKWPDEAPYDSKIEWGFCSSIR